MEPIEIREKALSEVMKQPIVSYVVYGGFADAQEICPSENEAAGTEFSRRAGRPKGEPTILRKPKHGGTLWRAAGGSADLPPSSLVRPGASLQARPSGSSPPSASTPRGRSSPSSNSITG